jgi:hypothetical protein
MKSEGQWMTYLLCVARGALDSVKEKGQVETRPGLLGESAHNKQPAAVIIFWLSVVEALPSFAHKPRALKRWPLRPRS